MASTQCPGHPEQMRDSPLLTSGQVSPPCPLGGKLWQGQLWFIPTIPGKAHLTHRAESSQVEGQWRGLENLGGISGVLKGPRGYYGAQGPDPSRVPGHACSIQA